MKSKVAVFNGTGINRYGMAFTVGALESALAQSWKYGVPSCISHDLHRPFAWSKGKSLYIEPGLVRLAGLVYSPEDKKDEEELQGLFQAKMSALLKESFEPHAAALYSRLSKVLSEDHYPLMPACATFVDKNLVLKTFPFVYKNQDKNGLIPLSDLNPIGPGAFEIDGLLLFAHSFFRRSLSRHNSLNTPFLTRFQKEALSYGSNAKIAIDPDMVGLASSYNEYIELEYWWGPKFNNELGTIDFGVTRHEANDDQKMFHGISATEFWWHNQDDIRTLECEEIRDMPSFGVGKDSFGCRYVHSMLDPIKSIPNHMDGAVRMYNETAMIERLEANIAKSGKNSNYQKLWRIDGEIQISVWKELLNDYFRDNRLVGEYLGAVEDNNHNTPRELINKTYSPPLSKYVPCDMQPTEGVRISVSYHEKTNSNSDSISFIPTGFFLNENGQHDYIEYDSIEVAKLLRRNGHEVAVPEDAMLIAFEDMLLNFPRIHHVGENSVDLAQATQNAFLLLLTTWCQREEDRVISFTMSVSYDDKDVYFSYAGHVNDLLVWFKSKESILPKTKDMVGPWADAASNSIDNKFKIRSIDLPPLHDLFQKDGMLIFKRRFLKGDEYRMRYDDSSGSIVGDLKIPKEEKNLFDIISSGKLSIACAFWVRDSQCSMCQSSYHICSCSKYVDDGVIQNMTDTPILGPFWTNRKA